MTRARPRGPALTGGLTSQLPTLVGKDKTPRAFGLDSLFYNVASMVGPAVAATIPSKSRTIPSSSTPL